eukprot:scaffold28477_cov112-Isochrysis_galbana.AAC.1
MWWDGGADRERAFAESRARRNRAEQRFLDQEEEVHRHDAAAERFPAVFGVSTAARRVRGAEDPLGRPPADTRRSGRRRFSFLSRSRSAPRSPVQPGYDRSRHDPDVDEQEPSPVSIMNTLHPSSPYRPAPRRVSFFQTPPWIHRARTVDASLYGGVRSPALPRAASARSVGASESAAGAAAQAAEMVRLAAERVRAAL